MENVTTKNLKVAGNIISELSEKIPSSIIALNELIKNSYDAFASKVTISFENNSKLIIEDNGIGMDENDIEKLFHISKSDKTYGKLITNKNLNLSRITQGSKGLGFLSVFKFGNFVKWTTAKGKIESTFSIDKNELLKTEDLSKFEVNITKRKANYVGTKIEIDIDKKEFDAKELINTLENEASLAKIVNSFYDKEFNIIIKGKAITKTEDKNIIIDKALENLIFKVKYSTKEGKIKYFRNKKIIQELDFKTNKSKFSLELEINIYYFGINAKNKKTNISKLFFKNDREITPLIYINNNLFNNYELFNPNAMRGISNQKTLPQMTGYINIICSNDELQFNSDRTRFVDSELTKEIESFLKKLNELIQSNGAKIKAQYIDDIIARHNINLNKESEKKQKHIKAASINLKQENFFYTVPTEQLDLYEECIANVKNSDGENIDKREIEITTIGANCTDGILESIEQPQEIEVKFKYTDKKTKSCIASTTIFFDEKKTNLKGAKEAKLKNFIAIPGEKTYIINIGLVNSLINQVNKLYIKTGYEEVIASSLRVIFDACIYALANHDKKNILNLEKGRETEKNVRKVINYILNHKNKLTNIDNNTKIGFNTLKNKLNETDFGNAAEKSNLGAHWSKMHLSDLDLKDIADKIGFFAMLTNELLKTTI